ncbi:hypothetical protein NDU88_002889 [Pleurodeles waltl]|uniref:Uncharacterized protein n=1 Tax=Pleurodeles waltl TaxID=8319 RepID=A0AAV7SC95_PLEWA|nr:hypothetical protein NDU88_002889 [Pleurodeles waltl]
MLRPNLLRSSVEQWSIEDARKKMKKVHDKPKLYYDDKKGTKQVNIKVGDSVRIKRACVVPKDECRFYEPEEVVEVLCNAVGLSNGKVWNLNRVAHYDKGIWKQENKDSKDLKTVFGDENDFKEYEHVNIGQLNSKTHKGVDPLDHSKSKQMGMTNSGVD